MLLIKNFRESCFYFYFFEALFTLKQKNSINIQNKKLIYKHLFY